jgi:GH35 family endo-1,4-beta-xylanase
MEPDAPWRKAAAERIQKHRKADLAITVTDSAGNPVPDAKVMVKMTRHAFKFGTAVNADVLVNHLGKSADTYREKVATLFNLATLENHHKYSGWIYPENRETANRAVDWLREKGLDIRGHVLVWPGWRYNPPQMRQLANDPAALRKTILDHITDIMTANKGKLLYWDVLNEPYTNHDFMDILGKDAIIEWFKHAHSVDPAPRLFINDYSILTNAGANTAHQEAYFGYIEYLLQNGAPLHALGEQSHFGWLLTAPDRVMEILDRMASYGLPIHITELDINITDRELQAAYMRDYMTVVFSHPAVEGITLWGFWEGAHWAPDAAFWTRDWQLRPVGKAWLNLVHRDWKTEATLTTDQDGRVGLRGYLGDYEITVKKGDLSKKENISLFRNGSQVTIVLD